MTKFFLTVVIGFVIGQTVLGIIILAPDAVWDIESHIAMAVVGPIISIMTIYGNDIYCIVTRK
jgi:hypothetical protein